MPTINGKPVGRTGYGMMNLTWRETPIPDEQAFAALKAALNSGANLWNGGELYGKPHANSLHLLNRYFTKYPEDAEKVIISIKGSISSTKMGPDNSEKNIRRSIDECLKVLDGKKFLDLFEPARQDPNVPLEETMSAMAKYIKEGKLGGISLSEVTEDQIRKAEKLHKVAAVEVEMSLHSPDILNNGVAKTCAELNIPLIAYSPLGRGLLTATFSKPEDIDKGDIRHHLPRFQPGNMEKNAAMGLEVQKVAKAKGCTPGQVALAWVRSYSGREGFGTIIPIPGSTTEERAVENATEVTLSDEELKEIEDIMKKTEVAGGRY
ncbi:MAG: Pyridoxine 4-dehydrogenase [Alectoria sarmentosa]|nr:MAG: Pyridoxine 4-dehydrogenase [Alectoria sarmentosa]CAD6583957.1 MAG: Pyridoxine 4-dehydrogenase [Alectoria sarmentosa]